MHEFRNPRWKSESGKDTGQSLEGSVWGSDRVEQASGGYGTVVSSALGPGWQARSQGCDRCAHGI